MGTIQIDVNTDKSKKLFPLTISRLLNSHDLRLLAYTYTRNIYTVCIFNLFIYIQYMLIQRAYVTLFYLPILRSYIVHYYYCVQVGLVKRYKIVYKSEF